MNESGSSAPGALRGAAPPSPQAVDRAGVEGLLPHRGPMLLIERIPWLEPGLRATAVAGDLAALAPGIPRDRPGEVPPELLIEGAAQTVAAVVCAGNVEAGTHPRGMPQPGVLAGVSEFRFHALVPAGAEVSFRVELAKRVSRIHIFRCEVHAGAALAASGTLSVAVGKPGE